MGDMNTSNSQQSRKTQIANAICDESTASIIEWGTTFVKENVPKALDRVAATISEILSSTKSKEKGLITNSVQKAIYAGIEIGEDNMEQALVLAMQRMNMDDEQINLIVKTAQQYLVTKEMIESARKG